jgi:uncharacterized protein with beta-barrel porin domain
VCGKTTFTFNGTEVLAKGMVGWRYAVDDVKPTVSETFSGRSSFDISGVPIARNQAAVDFGPGPFRRTIFTKSAYFRKC